MGRLSKKEAMKRVLIDEENPLDLIEGETERANQALIDYAMMGGGHDSRRSLRNLAKEYKRQSEIAGVDVDQIPTTRINTLEKWASMYRWRERVSIFDSLATMDREIEYKVRQQEWDEKSWEMANILYDKVIQMLKFPLVEQITKDGKTIIKPVNWKLSDVSKMLAEANKLARLSTQRAESSVDLNVAMEQLPDNIDAAELDSVIDAMVQQIAMGITRQGDKDYSVRKDAVDYGDIVDAEVEDLTKLISGGYDGSTQ